MAKPPAGRPVGADLDRPLRRLEEAGDGEEERRLAAAARADDRKPLVGRDRQVRLLEREHVAEPVANALDDDVRGNPLVLFIRRYRRVRVQMPTLGLF
jgi:hypothetical protein